MHSRVKIWINSVSFGDHSRIDLFSRKWCISSISPLMYMFFFLKVRNVICLFVDGSGSSLIPFHCNPTQQMPQPWTHDKQTVAALLLCWETCMQQFGLWRGGWRPWSEARTLSHCLTVGRIIKILSQWVQWEERRNCLFSPLNLVPFLWVKIHLALSRGQIFGS